MQILIMQRVTREATHHYIRLLYNITQSNGRTVSVYCNMEGSNCDGNGGWMRVGYINMTQPHATCPEGLYKYTLGSLALYVIDKIFLVKDVIPHSFHPTDCNI